MLTEPILETRTAQPYLAIRSSVPMGGIGAVVPHIDTVREHLARLGVAPSGPPFFRYVVVDMERELEIEVGWTVSAPAPGDGDRIIAGVFPAGVYAVAVHTGHPDDLVDATSQLLAWGQREGVVWDATPDQRDWTARIERYFSNPDEEPDRNQWRTELAFLTVAP